MSDHRTIHITRVLEEAWQHTLKKLWPILLISVTMLAATVAFQWILEYLFGLDNEFAPYYLIYLVLPILTNALIAPFYAGAVMTGVRQVRHESVTWQSGFHYFNRWGQLALAMAVIGFIASLGILLINAPFMLHLTGYGWGKVFSEFCAGLFSTLVYALFIKVIPLIAEENRGLMDACRDSLSRTVPHIWRIFALFLCIYVILLLITLPSMLGSLLANPIITLLGLVFIAAAMIWFLPFTFLTLGIVYRNLSDRPIQTPHQ